MFTVSEVFDATKSKSYHNYGNEKCRTPFTFYVDIGGYIMFPYVDMANQCGFKTKDEAEKFKEQFVKNITDPNNVYAVMRDDKFEAVFKSVVSAHQYIMSKGCTYFVHYGTNVNGQLYGSATYQNDCDNYSIMAVPLRD